MNYRFPASILETLCTLSVLLFFGCAKQEPAKTQTEHHEGDGHDHSGHVHTEGDGHNHNNNSDEPQSTIAGVDWCPEHRVPESLCTKCNPALIPAFKAKNDWCAGHEVPESHCYLCNPGIRFKEEDAYKTAIQPKHKPATSLYRPNSKGCTSEEKIIQFANAETAARAGIEVQTAVAAEAAAVIEAPAEIEFDAIQSYAVTSLVEGTLTQWVVQPGQAVAHGDLLAYIESIEGANLRAEYSHARALLNVSKAAYERQKELSAGQLTSRQDLESAEATFLRDEADYKKTLAALRALGFTERDVQEDRDDNNPAQIPIRARRNGILVEQKVELGSLVANGESIGLISSLDKLWVEAQVRERELTLIKTGQTAEVSLDGDALHRSAGIVRWVADGVDPVTRMGRVRIEVPGHRGLRAHQFVSVNIHVADPAESVVIPADAVQWEGCCNIVFVKEAADRFRPRKVQVLFDQHGKYAVSGVHAGEQIVTEGSYLLKTELLKGSLGAGCCGEGA